VAARINVLFDTANKVAGTLRRAAANKVAGTLRRAVRSRAFASIPGGRHMECAYYFEIPGGRHMECAYYFDFCRLCPVWLPSPFPRSTILVSNVP
jgi:hypothetical protein